MKIEYKSYKEMIKFLRTMKVYKLVSKNSSLKPYYEDIAKWKK